MPWRRRTRRRLTLERRHSPTRGCHATLTKWPHRRVCMKNGGMFMRLATATAAALIMVCAPVWAQKEFAATLAGHVTLPSETFIDTPADAPADLKVSAKYTTGKRIEVIGSVMGKSFERPTGVSLPFKGQPIHDPDKKLPFASCTRARTSAT